MESLTILTPVTGDTSQDELRDYIRAWLGGHDGMDTKVLAERAGVHPASLYNFMSGQKRMGADMLSKLAKAMEESADKLFRLGGLIDAPSLPDDDPLWNDLKNAFDNLDTTADRMAAIRLVWTLGKSRKADVESNLRNSDSTPAPKRKRA